MYFLNILDSTALQSLVRSSELSKRLLDYNAIPIILTQKLKRKINAILPSKIKTFYSGYFEVKNPFLLFFFNNFFNIDFYLNWLPFAYLKSKRIFKRYKKIKFIYASGPKFYTHLLGFFLKKKYKIPLVIEYRDPWTSNPYNELRWYNKITYLIEKTILRSADIIITISPSLAVFLKKNFPFIDENIIISIPNGLTVKKSNQNLSYNQNKISIIFTGRLYGKRDIFPLFKILSDLKKEFFFQNKNFELKLFGTYPKTTLKLVEILKITDLIYLGNFISRKKAFEEIFKSDLAIHIGESFDYPTIAFKVWDYLSCGKKIIYFGLNDSFTAEFIKKYNLGQIIPINDLKKAKLSFKEIIIDFLNNPSEYKIKDNQLSEFLWDKRVEIFINKIIYKYENNF